MDLSIVIPVYRSAASVGPLYEAIMSSCAAFVGQFELILVEDCGGDDSWEQIQGLASVDSRVRGLRLTRNFGQHYALTAGLSVSSGKWVVTMDCDLQDDPSCIPVLLQTACDRRADVVLVRRLRRADSWMNRVTSKAFYGLFRMLSGLEMDPAVGSYRLMSRRVVQQYLQLPERYRFFGGLIQWLGFPTVSVDLPHRRRFAGRSSYNLLRRVRLAMDAVLSFSDRPLKAMVAAGAAISTLSAIYAVVILFQRLTSRIPEIGYASVIISLYLLTGVILICTGVLGLYVGRVYHEVKGRPIFVIAEDTRES